MPNEFILLFDDELSIIQSTCIYQESEGFRMQDASDGATASKYHPALIVLDAMLPDRNDFEICRKKLRTGLWLSVVQQIVQAHGGRISVRSDRVGTTFDVVLPHARSSASALVRHY